MIFIKALSFIETKDIPGLIKIHSKGPKDHEISTFVVPPSSPISDFRKFAEFIKVHFSEKIILGINIVNARINYDSLPNPDNSLILTLRDLTITLGRQIIQDRPSLAKQSARIDPEDLFSNIDDYDFINYDHFFNLDLRTNKEVPSNKYMCLRIPVDRIDIITDNQTSIDKELQFRIPAFESIKKIVQDKNSRQALLISQQQIQPIYNTIMCNMFPLDIFFNTWITYLETHDLKKRQVYAEEMYERLNVAFAGVISHRDILLGEQSNLKIFLQTVETKKSIPHTSPEKIPLATTTEHNAVIYNNLGFVHAQILKGREKDWFQGTLYSSLNDYFLFPHDHIQSRQLSAHSNYDVITSIKGKFLLTTASILPTGLYSRTKDKPSVVSMKIYIPISKIHINSSKLNPRDLDINYIVNKIKSVRPLFLKTLPVRGSSISNSKYTWMRKLTQHPQLRSFLYTNSKHSYLYLANKALPPDRRMISTTGTCLRANNNNIDPFYNRPVSPLYIFNPLAVKWKFIKPTGPLSRKHRHKLNSRDPNHDLIATIAKWQPFDPHQSLSPYLNSKTLQPHEGPLKKRSRPGSRKPGPNCSSVNKLIPI
jgi:hypothetical protein